MKYNKIIKLTVCVIVMHLFFIDMQYCAESSYAAQLKTSLIAPKPIRPANAVQRFFIEKYKDEEVVRYWTTTDMLSRINMNSPYFNMTQNEMLEELILKDICLRGSRDTIKNKLYLFKMYQIKKNPTYSDMIREQLLLDFQKNEQEIKKSLWIQFLYVTKDGIHKDVENKKVNNSLSAWPYAKEIQAARLDSRTYLLGNKHS